ncbi:hypothetical protein Daura_28565 [Dactylosporangium aurantiacum]|uniref:Uncharacterized protein n=1 Tax=Dactylosporangium aurantiacum TaxID=35754 RepID=A0A9Q9IB52_9ACTN|nr:hypothetical protein [Dactylosporangium aurantiacum]MDG6106605.1 hypothetical protein [Dactylosporangium aurantiacum]UWZ50767.1 hypothetical protein Daura_28565 [Dactylosporangium aurantiacum]
MESLPDGSDPRRLPLGAGFSAPLTTVPRGWPGGGAPRVTPVDEPYQVRAA